MRTFGLLMVLLLFCTITSVIAFPKIWLTEVKFLIGMVMALCMYIVIKDTNKDEK